ncbi:MAG: hypothetical protein R3349_01040, partial [Geminicoccaceae bacterium]|nr:hypothetical protein [Geminicoccaceae bacterium]
LALALVEEPAAIGVLRASAEDQVERFSLTSGIGAGTELSIMRGWSLGTRFGLTGVDPGTAGVWLTPSAAHSPYLAFTNGGDGLALGGEISPGTIWRVGLARAEPPDADLEVGRRSVAVAELVRTWDQGAAVAVQVGSLAEEASLLDTAGGGALALDGAATGFVGLAARMPIIAAEDGERGLHLFGHLNHGVTRAAVTSRGLIRDISTLHSTAFAAGVAQTGVFRSFDQLALSVAQPIRIDAGSMTVDLPVARAFDGTIERRRERVSLAPAGRELDVELAYRLPLAANQQLSVNWLTRIQPDHDPTAPPSHAIGAKWSARF